MSRLGLEEEEEVGILLHFSIIGKMAFGGVYVFKRSLDFPLLCEQSSDNKVQQKPPTHLVQGHSVLNQQGDTRVQVSHISLQHEILF
jgi:hypothetical protein